MQRTVQVEAYFEGRTQPKRGSGFRLAKGRILTCRHVIEDLEGDRPLEKIVVSRDVDGSGAILKAKATCIWRGPNPEESQDLRALDAAVLEDGFEDDPGSFERLVRLPQHAGSWSGFGFAVHATSTKKLHRPDRLTGDYDPVLVKEICLPLTVVNKAPKPPEKETGEWGGVSGGPVFVQGGPMDGHLYGLLRQKPESNEDRLYAVLIPALLRDPGFCEAISWTEPPAPHEGLMGECRQLLENLPELAEHLQNLDPSWAEGWRSAGCEGLLEAMCRIGDVETLLGGLEALASAVEDQPTKLETLRRSAVHLVGLLAHHELIRRGLRAMQEGRKVTIPVASPNFAEAFQAGSEGRPVLYKKKDGDLPGRVLEVPSSGLEAGIRRENLAKDQLEEIAMKFVEQHFDAPPYLFPTQRGMLKTEKGDERLKKLARAVDGNLKRFGKVKRGRPYLLLTPEARSHFLDRHLDEFLAYLGILLPSVTHLEIGGDVDAGLDLEAALHPLWNLLDLKGWEDP